jgi:hypothetical protein
VAIGSLHEEQHCISLFTSAYDRHPVTSFHLSVTVLVTVITIPHKLKFVNRNFYYLEKFFRRRSKETPSIGWMEGGHAGKLEFVNL